MVFWDCSCKEDTSVTSEFTAEGNSKALNPTFPPEERDAVEDAIARNNNRSRDEDINGERRTQPSPTMGDTTWSEDSNQPTIKYECDFDTDCTTLFKCLHNKNWERVINRAESYPIEAETWVSRKEKCGTKIRWRLLPLHSAIIFSAPEDVIEALLCSYPKGAQCKDANGMLPIHLAFRNGCSEDVINLLLVAYPKGIDTKDYKGRIPLDLAQKHTAVKPSGSSSSSTENSLIDKADAYVNVAAEARERAAANAMQRAIFEAKLIEVRTKHSSQMERLRNESAGERIALEQRINELETELSSTQTELWKTQNELSKQRKSLELYVSMQQQDNVDIIAPKILQQSS